MKRERTNIHERANYKARTKVAERASRADRIRGSERANVPDRNMAPERAIEHERATPPERTNKLRPKRKKPMNEVEKEKRVESMNDIVNMSADMMSEVYNDGRMTVAEKIKAFGQAQRIIISTRAEQRRTGLDLQKMGMKPNGNMAALTFDANENE